MERMTTADLPLAKSGLVLPPKNKPGRTCLVRNLTSPDRILLLLLMENLFNSFPDSESRKRKSQSSFLISSGAGILQLQVDFKAMTLLWRLSSQSLHGWISARHGPRFRWYLHGVLDRRDWSDSIPLPLHPV